MPTSAIRQSPDVASARPERPSRSTLRVVRSPLATTPSLEVNRTAAANVHAHTRWLVLRVLGLIAVDLAAIECLRLFVGALESRAILSAQVVDAVARALPAGFLATFHATPALLLALWLCGAYGHSDRRRDVGRLLLAAVVATAIPLWDALWGGDRVVALQFLNATVLTAGALVLARLVLDRGLARFTAGRITRAILVGPAAAVDAEWERRAATGGHSIQAVERFAIDDPSAGGLSERMAQLGELLATHRADTLLLCGDVDDDATFTALVRAAAIRECRVLAVTRRLDMPGIRPSIVWDRGLPAVELRSAGLRGQQLVLKRLLDIVTSVVLLVLLAPLMAMLAVAVRMGSPGPAVYGQSRLGRHGRSFRCLKFRSMYADAEQRLRMDPGLYAEYVSNDFKLPDGSDPRITPIGRILRRTSLDELPQLWNVLRGEMSLVGPRPIVPDEIRHYVGDEQMLLLLKPGITGSWQVSGRSNVSYPQRTQLELDYVERWSLTGDVMILLQTVPAVLLQRGAH